MNIPTWQDYIKPEYHDTPSFTKPAMQAEINELRAELERLTLGWNAANVDVLHHAMTIDAQHKVLEQAEVALKHLHHNAFRSGAEMGLALTVASTAITAIQEQLK